MNSVTTKSLAPPSYVFTINSFYCIMTKILGKNDDLFRNEIY